MKRLVYAFFVVNFLTVFFQPAVAVMNGNSNHFNGLWKGVDNLDGSVTLLSISDVDGDGIMTVRLTDSYFSKCKNAGYPTTPGLVDGTGTIQNNQLTFDFSFKCFDPATNKFVEINKDSIKMTSYPKQEIIVDDEGEIFHHISNH